MRFLTNEELAGLGVAPMTDEDRRLIEYLASLESSPEAAALSLMRRSRLINAALNLLFVPVDEMSQFLLLIKGIEGLANCGKSFAEIRSIALMTIASKERIAQFEKGKGDAKQED